MTSQANTPGQDVVEYDPDAVVHVAVHPTDQPGFENIHFMRNTTKPISTPALRHQPEGYPHADHLVPDDAFVVVHAQVVGDLAAQPEAEQHGHSQHQPVAPVRQHLPQREERDGHQRPCFQVPGALGRVPEPKPKARKCQGLRQTDGELRRRLDQDAQVTLGVPKCW